MTIEQTADTVFMAENDALFAELDKIFDEVEAKEFSAVDLPDGKYQAFIYAAQKNVVNKDGSKRHGYWIMQLRFRVMSGPCRGQNQQFSRFFSPTDVDSMGFLKKDLATLGVTEAMAQQSISVRSLMTEHMDIFLDRVCEIQVKRSKNNNDPDNPYVNVYINRLLNGVAIPEELRTATASSHGGGGGGEKPGNTGGIAW